MAVRAIYLTANASRHLINEIPANRIGGLLFESDSGMPETGLCVTRKDEQSS